MTGRLLGGAMAAGAVAGERIRALAGDGVPGVAALAAGPEAVRAAGAAGLADIAGGCRPPGMVCPWFSMTKIVTATAAMRLAERGVLDLDTPVSGHVPRRCGRCGRRGWARRITARHLLSYSAGLANPVPVRWVHPAGQPAPDRRCSWAACWPGTASCGSSPGHGQVIRGAAGCSARSRTGVTERRPAGDGRHRVHRHVADAAACRGRLPPAAEPDAAAAAAPGHRRASRAVGHAAALRS